MRGLGEASLVATSLELLAPCLRLLPHVSQAAARPHERALDLAVRSEAPLLESFPMTKNI